MIGFQYSWFLYWDFMINVHLFYLYNIILLLRLYSFGFGRVEILSGFINSLFLVSIATVVLSEALTRLVDPPNINTDKLLVSYMHCTCACS